MIDMMFNGTRDDSWELYCKVGRVKSARVFSTLIPTSKSKKLTQDMKLNDKDEWENREMLWECWDRIRQVFWR